MGNIIEKLGIKTMSYRDFGSGDYVFSKIKVRDLEQQRNEMLEALEKIIKAQYSHKASLLTLNVAIFDAREMLIDKFPEIKELLNE